MRKRILITLAATLFAAVALSAQNRVIRLYEGEAPGYEGMEDHESFDGRTAMNVVNPTLTVYLPDPDKATGAAMIVAPGGAYVTLSMDYEGYDVASYLADHGVAAFVLKYRTRPLGKTPEESRAKLSSILGDIFRPDADRSKTLTRIGDTEESRAVRIAHEDGLQAMKLVRSMADEFGIDPERIGIMGFSAGAVLAMNVGMHHDASSRPALVAPVYVGWVDPIEVPEDAAPLYLVSPQNDLFAPHEPFDLYQAWTKAGIDAELHYHAGVQHGFGMRKLGKTVDNWIDGLYSFMQQTRFVNTTTVNSVTIQDGGDGPFRSVVVEDAELPGYTIVRPQNLKAASKDGPMPVILFGNGGCTRDSWFYLPLLTQIASQGYVIITNGHWTAHGIDGETLRRQYEAIQNRPAPAPAQNVQREEQPRPAPAMGQGGDQKKLDALDYIRALDWLEKKAADPKSEYFGTVDTHNTAAMGQSCGGLQALVLSTIGDKRIKTTVALNSGAFPVDAPMYLLSKEDLSKLSNPIIYIIGGESDIAYPNATDDYRRITGVPVVLTNLPVGHNGTYIEYHGGEFTDMALLWLDAQMKGKTSNMEYFKKGTLPEGFSPEWTVVGKNF
ncbi:MAG: alpha/beta hydrolase [Bacteroidales bacterium]|nr:alpha/beta hydrolase [Bacteroidales bacterium]